MKQVMLMGLLLFLTVRLFFTVRLGSKHSWLQSCLASARRAWRIRGGYHRTTCRCRRAGARRARPDRRAAGSVGPKAPARARAARTDATGGVLREVGKAGRRSSSFSLIRSDDSDYSAIIFR